MLASPRVVKIQFVSRGRHDITREAFDDGKPVCLNLGTSIVECIEVVTSPEDRPHPAWTTDGPWLLIGPSHFGRRQRTVFYLLVDGESPHIVPPQQSLVDVRIEHGDGETLKGDGVRRGVATAGLVLVALATYTYVTHGPHALFVAFSFLIVGILGVLMFVDRKVQ